jgi:alanine racemase
MSRTALAVLSTENLIHNLAIIQSKVPQAKIMAMVKANAYGHGLRSVALRLQEHVAGIGVASIDEALALRKVGVRISITLMEGIFEPDELLIASCEGFHVVFHTMEQIKWLESSTSLPLPLTAWLKIDTGMGRLGFEPEQVSYAYSRLALHKQIIKPVGYMSHLACADVVDHPLNQQQLDLFATLTQNTSGAKSICNSAAIFAFTHHQYDVVRPGLALYGISPFSTSTAKEFDLKPVMTLQTRLISIRMARKDSAIGYGAHFHCPEDMPIGVIAIGYGDGYPRSARNGTPILVNGVRCTIVGRVSMDMLTIDLRPYPQAKVNDQVILWGNGLPLEEIVPYTNNSPYDILTSVQSRVKFLWTQNKKYAPHG